MIDIGWNDKEPYESRLHHAELNGAYVSGYKQGYQDAFESLGKNEQPTGEWEIEDEEGGKIWNCVCTECGHDPQEYIGGTDDWWLTKSHLPNFCPNCGVRIVNVKGGEDNEQ